MEDYSKTNLVIYQSTDYDKFKFFPSNRDVLKNFKLENDIINHNHLMYHPIEVTSDLHIVDGQHRFLICKSQKLPVFFMINPTATEDDVMHIQSARTWALKDFLHHWAKKGKPSYIDAQKLLNKYPITITNFLSAFSTNSKNSEGFRAGNFKLSRSLEMVDEILRSYFKVRAVIEPYVETKLFPKAFERSLIWMVDKITHTPTASIEKFISKLRANPALLDKAFNYRQIPEIKEILRERIYNHGRSTHRLE